MAQAQAQVQRQGVISHTESLELVRCLLRVSIFHVSYLRGLFPDAHYRGVDMKNLDGMHIKMLSPACEESRRLIDWVEGGVYDAIRRGYLKTLFFGISVDPEGSHLLEEYIFNFNYGNNGVSMDLMQKRGASSKRLYNGTDSGQSGQTANDLDSVRYQVTRLMRMLVQICQTLDKVPTERFLFMKLMYHDHTPEHYEPPYFVPVNDSGIGHFARKPFSMTVGAVGTKHHNVTLKVKSTLDACETEPEEEEEEATEAPHEEEQTGDTGAAGGDDHQVAMGQDGRATAGGTSTVTVAPEVLERIKAYCNQCSQVDMMDAMCSFMDVPPPVLEAAFGQLQLGGVLQLLPGSQPGVQHTYAVVGQQRQQQEAMDEDQDVGDEIANRMHTMAVDDDAAVVADQLPELPASRHKSKQQGGSKRSGSTAAPAPEAGCDTGSASGRRRKRGSAPAGAESAQQAAEAAAAAVAAGGSSRARVRKASFVCDPIHQQKRHKASSHDAPSRSVTNGMRR